MEYLFKNLLKDKSFENVDVYKIVSSSFTNKKAKVCTHFALRVAHVCCRHKIKVLLVQT